MHTCILMHHCIMSVTGRQSLIDQLTKHEVFGIPDTTDPIESEGETADPVVCAIWEDCCLEAAWHWLEYYADDGISFYGDHTIAQLGPSVCAGNFASAEGLFRHVESLSDGSGPAVPLDRRTMKIRPEALDEVTSYVAIGRQAERDLGIPPTQRWFS